MSKEKEDKLIAIKIILLGETGTGKTSLINIYFSKNISKN